MKYFKIAIILTLVAGLSGILISSLNLITSPIIEENNKEAENKSCSEIFADCDFESVSLEGKDSDIEAIYLAKKNGELVGYIYKMTGKNQFGKISIMLGITNGKMQNFKLIKNEQTAPLNVKNHVKDNYVNDLEINDVNSIDVYCGATYGAKLVQSLVQKAFADYNESEGLK